MFQTDGPEPVIPTEDTSSTPAAATSPASAPSESVSERGSATPTGKNIPSEESAKTNAQEQSVVENPQKPAPVTTEDKVSEAADGSEPTVRSISTPSTPAAATSPVSAPSESVSERGSAAPEPAKNIPPEESAKTNAQEQLAVENPQQPAQVATEGKASEVADGSRPTVQSILKLLSDLNPPNQLDRLMTLVGMPHEHRPSLNQTLAQRSNEFLDWAFRAGDAMIAKVVASLKDLIRPQFNKRAPHPNAPKASMRDASSELREDSELVPSYVETLTPASGLLPIPAQQTSSWAERLHAGRLLLLSCEDPGTLNAAARTIPFHNLFAAAEKLLVVRRGSPTVWQVLEARRSAPGLVVAYAVKDFGERWLKSLLDEFDLTTLRGELERTLTWLFVLTNPETAKRAGFDLKGSWIEDRIDFIGPRLRGALGQAGEELEAEFRLQLSKGYWGETDDKTLRLLNDAILNGTLREDIEIHAKGDSERLPIRQTPDWNVLLATSDVQDLALYELILFVAAFFLEGEDTGECGLAVNRFDALIRSLIPIAAKDAGIFATSDTGPSALEQLSRAWLTRGEQLRTSAGLRTVRSSSGASMIKFAVSSWRDEALTIFTSAAGSWRFSRLAEYVRRREFVFGPEDAAHGAGRVAAAELRSSSGNDSAELLDWILACTQARTAGAAKAEKGSLSDEVNLLSRQERIVLGSWISDVLRELQSPTAPAALLGNLINAGAQDLTAAILLGLWGTAGFENTCTSLARRLLGEASSETKDEVLSQMRAAMRRGDLPLLEIWKNDWLPTGEPDPGPPGRAAARLFVELVESSIGGLRSHQLFRNIFDGDNASSVAALVSLLWHPAVDNVIRERRIGIAALPGLWILPADYRRHALNGAWEPADALLTFWWFGFMVTISEDSAGDDPLPLVFRAMTVCEWTATCGHKPIVPALSSAIVQVLSPKALREFRLYLRGFDAALGEVLQVMLSGTVIHVNERRAIEARVRPLRDHIRSLRGAAVPTAAGPERGS